MSLANHSNSNRRNELGPRTTFQWIPFRRWIFLFFYWLFLSAVGSYLVNSNSDFHATSFITFSTILFSSIFISFQRGDWKLWKKIFFVLSIYLFDLLIGIVVLACLESYLGFKNGTLPDGSPLSRGSLVWISIVLVYVSMWFSRLFVKPSGENQ